MFLEHIDFFKKIWQKHCTHTNVYNIFNCNVRMHQNGILNVQLCIVTFQHHCAQKKVF